MIPKYSIGIVGTGNLGFHLSHVLENAGHHIEVIYGRDQEKAQLLANGLVAANVTDSLDLSRFSLDLVILCVSDNAVKLLAERIMLPDNATLVHTAGSVPMRDLMHSRSQHFGVFYPLQTFSKNDQVQFRALPIIIEANNREGEELLTQLANSIDAMPEFMNSFDRSKIHLAAIMVNNFTNHLLDESFAYLRSQKINPELMYPLLKKTVEKAIELGPENSQTGPAIRGDTSTLEDHMKLLTDNQQLRTAYKFLSSQILDKWAAK